MLHLTLLLESKSAAFLIHLYFSVYVDIGNGASDTATLAFAFTGSSTSRKWDIKVAQIPCSTTYT